ncbi:LSM-domain-containing protein [Metschnikowia bicuspidata var. bicuspidata NRRL YB-4993]|uniref:LSM-domain-containing protein n=1 Tax=Metschnikowia bicuspidata var. bicuspidata NRRL YB-4993 TaxID=869754 RepID=A0A1A0HBD9_9ASCO|nr:LSM-domain-containing protein [Metschnikowia bicuspidata var. bicuspidata NRRL YB-4993]OBA21203.1 LSM-domain-containing protein [Metschnikowia bicuspidata var. bicuspidata NRRL YB-4993]
MSEGLVKPSSDCGNGADTSNLRNDAGMLPLEVIDNAVGTQIKILLSNNKEFQGTLIGFDDFVNVVLQNVTEVDANGEKGRLIEKMLLNGAQIAMLCPA